MKPRALAAMAAAAAAVAPAAAVALLAAGCSASDTPAADGGGDAAFDAITGDALQALALDFAITGCARYDMAAARCYGGAPLALAFAPVSSPSLTQFLWSFGDGTPDSTARAPTHAYQLPGSYEVKLVGAGTVGTASSVQQITVTALLAGAPCDVSPQCAAGLTCVCGPGCPAPFGRGLCTSPCADGGAASACGAGAVCAQIPLPAGAFPPASDPGAGDGGLDGGGDGASGDGPGSDRASSDGDGRGDAAGDAAVADGGAPDGATIPAALVIQAACLGACQQDVDCPAGLACRDLPGGGAGSGGPRWARACYPRVGGDVGDPCRAATGALSDDACVTGACADLGALGACTASCGAGTPCPTGAACATLGDGRALCVRRCEAAASIADRDCARDPLLACTPPGGAGPLAFTVDDPVASAGGYCAPRPCAAPADCAPAGTCAGGRCIRD